MKKWPGRLALGVLGLLGSIAFTSEAETNRTTPDGLVTVSWGLGEGDDHCTEIWVDSRRSEDVRMDVEVYNAAGDDLVGGFDVEIAAGESRHAVNLCDRTGTHDWLALRMRALGETEIGGVTINPVMAGEPYPAGFPPERVGELPVRREGVPGPWRPGREMRWE